MSTKLTPWDRSSQAALWGPGSGEYDDPDLEALELYERARQALSDIKEEES